MAPAVKWHGQKAEGARLCDEGKRLIRETEIADN
jgi:hypothetical protein